MCSLLGQNRSLASLRHREMWCDKMLLVGNARAQFAIERLWRPRNTFFTNPAKPELHPRKWCILSALQIAFLLHRPSPNRPSTTRSRRSAHLHRLLTRTLIQPSLLVPADLVARLRSVLGDSRSDIEHRKTGLPKLYPGRQALCIILPSSGTKTSQ